jgi:hypothetical protein
VTTGALKWNPDIKLQDASNATETAATPLSRKLPQKAEREEDVRAKSGNERVNGTNA